MEEEGREGGGRKGKRRGILPRVQSWGAGHEYSIVVSCSELIVHSSLQSSPFSLPTPSLSLLPPLPLPPPPPPPPPPPSLSETTWAARPFTLGLPVATITWWRCSWPTEARPPLQTSTVTLLSTGPHTVAMTSAWKTCWRCVNMTWTAQA